MLIEETNKFVTEIVAMKQLKRYVRRYAALFTSVQSWLFLLCERWL